MTEVKKISKRKFDAVTKKFPPNLWIKFAYRFFSKETEKKDLILNNSITFILVGLFIIGFFGTALNAPTSIIKPVTIGYSILLSVLVLCLFSAVFLNNIRTGKIAKELGISKADYNDLVKKLYS